MAKRHAESPQRRPRSSNELRRRPPFHPPRQLILIVCEGAETEYRYFDTLRITHDLITVSIEIEPTAGQALSLVKSAIKRQMTRSRQPDALPYDEVWCVFDREGHNEPDAFRTAVTLADKEQLGLAVSNPCL